MTEKHVQDMKAELRKFIINNYLKRARNFQLSDDDSFLKKGILDSIGVIELTGFIQGKYKIRVRAGEIALENFDTLNNLERYITRKLKGSTS